MAVSMEFHSLKDFEPEQVVRKVPELNKLLELRQALTALKGPLSNIPEFRQKVQSLVKDEAAREQLLKELGVEK
jgi:type VI secretion system protein ImpB